MKRLTIHFLALLACFAISAAGAGEPVEGKDYVRLKNGQPVETGKKIEVIEFFSYGEPILDAWVAKLPPDVQFRRVPVIFQQRWEALARIYYTLDAMGDEARLSPEVFKAIHASGLPLYQDKAFFDWAAAHGLDRTKVVEVYGSFAVTSRFNRAKAVAQAYNIQSVPTMVVDGKYVTSSDRVGTHAAMPPVLDALIVKARAEHGKT
ncbi:MAG: thiol:disulfide interchange protein DsbA/DsbL [Betaproteobacteria bacterium]|nr:MAG: thiol:disulfide interchange protein DsbA/DsbL [Betaproteobacteria bacterium]